MLIGDAADTVMNVTTFSFIAALIWIYLRPGS